MKFLSNTLTRCNRSVKISIVFALAMLFASWQLQGQDGAETMLMVLLLLYCAVVGFGENKKQTCTKNET